MIFLLAKDCPCISLKHHLFKKVVCSNNGNNTPSHTLNDLSFKNHCPTNVTDDLLYLISHCHLLGSSPGYSRMLLLFFICDGPWSWTVTACGHCDSSTESLMERCAWVEHLEKPGMAFQMSFYLNSYTFLQQLF